MKQYTNSEVMVMLESNPKLKFKCDGVFRLFVRNNKIIIKNDFNTDSLCGFCIDDKWELIQEPVTFMEAANAFMNGKNVKCEYKSFSDSSLLNKTFKQGSQKGSMRENDDITFYMITEGKWYIEEDCNV